MRTSLFLFLAILSLTGCSGPYSAQKVAAKESPVLAVKVERTADEVIPEIVTATGELLAVDLAQVSAKVPGRLTKLLVDIGTHVEEREVIAEIEKDDYEFRVRQAEALVEQSRAQLGIDPKNKTDDVVPEQTSIARQAAASLKEARLIFGNTTRLHQEGVVSKVDFERAQVAFQAAEARYQGSLEQVMQLRAQLTERRAQLALARQQLSDCTIRAPFRGAITRRQASFGEYLAINAPVVFLVRQHPLRLRLEVPERLAVRVQAGQRVEVKLEGNPITRAGKVVRISPAIDAQNRSLTVEGEVPNEDGILRPGSFAEGIITINPNAHGVTVPRGALISFAGVERVFVVSGGQLDERLIRTGRRLPGERIEVLEGLKPGETLVRDANERMTKGQKVSILGS